MLTVSIFDKESTRRNCLAANLRSAGFTVREFGTNDVREPHATNLILMHFRDDYNEISEVERMATVYYGGGGEADDLNWERRKDTRSECYRIFRAIDRNGKGALSIEEAQGLMTFVCNINGIKILPPFLKQPHPFTKITALAILCQGYLSIHAPNKLAILDDQLHVQITTQKIIKKTSDSIWWQNVLYEKLPRSDATPPDKKSASGIKLKNLIAKEWKCQGKNNIVEPTVETLLDLIINDKKIDLKTVSDAYVSICDFFRKLPS